MQAGSEMTAGFMELKNSLREFLTKLSGAFRRQAAEPVLAVESAQLNLYHNLSRYIFQSGHFSSQKPKPGAFLPQPTQLKISAAWIDRLSEIEIWEVGDILGSQTATPRTPKARADFDAAILEEVNLAIEDDPVPHPRHVNLFGWPAEKDAQKSVALFLCSRAHLSIR